MNAPSTSTQHNQVARNSARVEVPVGVPKSFFEAGAQSPASSSPGGKSIEWCDAEFCRAWMSKDNDRIRKALMALDRAVFESTHP